jgi:very-short-patch-repair endonuclease
MVEKKCLNCGKVFKVNNYRKDTAKYCCRTCHDEGQLDRVTTKCEWCGKELVMKKSAFTRSKHHFCDLQCLSKWNAERTNTRVTKKCVICGKKYTVKLCEADHSYTCSIECQGKWQSKYRVGENAGNWRGGGKTLYCLECGKPFTSSHYNTKVAKTAKFCSQRCKRKYWAKNVINRESFVKAKLQGNLKMLSTPKPNNPRETKLEKAIRIYLEEHNITHDCQHIVNDKFCVDFFLPKQNIIIEALGDYWHGNPIKYNDSNMSDIQRKNKNKDKARFAYLNKCGYNIFGIWENDVNTDIEKAMKPVMDCIRTLETDITDTLTRV